MTEPSLKLLNFEGLRAEADEIARRLKNDGGDGIIATHPQLNPHTLPRIVRKVVTLIDQSVHVPPVLDKFTL